MVVNSLKIQRALLLANPNARRVYRSIIEAIAILHNSPITLIQEFPKTSAEISPIIRRYQNEVDCVIISGGDGTINAALDGLIDAQLPLAILPLGTANDLARTLSIPSTIAEACEVIIQGKQHKIDVGLVNDRYFLNVASMGLSVDITERLTKEAKQRWGVFAYVLTAVQVLFKARTFRATINFNEEIIKVKTIQIAVGNGRYYGGGMAVVHDATIDDQRLDLYSLELDYWWQLLRLLPAMRMGKHTTLSGVFALHGTELEIYTSKPYPINTDGEITTYTPARFRLIPRALTVIVP